jgi:hypothetical protein
MIGLILAMAHAAVAHGAAKPARTAATAKWTILEQQSTATDATPVLIAMKRAESLGPKAPAAPIRGLTGDHQGLYVAVRWPDSSMQTFARDRHVSISWTLDGKATPAESWSVNGNSALLRDSEGLRWFHSLAGSKRLVVFIGSKNDRAQATFDLTGIDKVDTKLQAMTCGKAAAAK